MMTPVVIRFFPGILHKMANSKWVSKVSGVFFFGMTELPSSSATFLELTDRVTMTSSNGANNMGAPPGSAAAMVQHGGQVLLNWKPVISATAKGLVTWLTNLLFLLGIFDWFFCTETCWWFSLFCLDRLLLKKKTFWVWIHCYCQSLRQFYCHGICSNPSQWRPSLWRFPTVNRDCSLLKGIRLSGAT